VPRYELSLFDGGEDPLLWLRQCERYGRLHAVPQEEWVEMAGMHLRGEAQEVLDNWETEDRYISWPEFQGSQEESDSSNSATPAAHIWSTHGGLVFRKQRLFIPATSSFRSQVVAAYHNVTHEGVHKTLHRIKQSFFWENLRGSVEQYIHQCAVCQQHKASTLAPAGLLQPLSIPQHIWPDISMDFIVGLPKSQGKSALLVVVDRLSKYGHFIAIKRPATASAVADIFFDQVVRLHGVPESIVSDRDPVFTSTFWQNLFKCCGTKLLTSSSYHPQTDGQTEVVNRTIEMYLRCLATERPSTWVQWLPWAEFCYNSSYHLALRMTPFELVYGRKPPPLVPYSQGTTLVDVVDSRLVDRDALLD
jgi:hypothetical protein